MDYYVTKHQKKLRCGITTGTCAAAAAKAAAAKLLLGVQEETVSIHTPKGITVSVPVFLSGNGENFAECKVIKDSGDDPDVTNQAEIYVRVENYNDIEDDMLFHSEEFPKLHLDGGIGVGRVTKDGLEQKKGQAAINVVPRQMIFQAVGEICNLAEYEGELMIVVWVPEGEELAVRTFNPRLGIEGGISILGTSGILEPMSEKAIVDTIESQIRQLQAQGKRHLLVTPGNYGQAYASEYLGLSLEDSIKCSNYIGEMLDLAVAYGMRTVLLTGNAGKLVKLAAGIMNTHSRVADGRCEIFAVHAVLCGGSAELVARIMECINTEEILQLLEEEDLRIPVCGSLCRKIGEHLNRRAGDKVKVGVVLFSEHFGYLGETEEAAEILQEYRRQG